MINIIYCKTVAKGIQEFYLRVESKEYYLFKQNYRVSNKEVYRAGIRVNEIRRFKSHYSKAVRRIAEKLYIYISYIEKDYGVAVLNKTKKKEDKKKCFYSRKHFDFNGRYAM